MRNPVEIFKFPRVFCLIVDDTQTRGSKITDGCRLILVLNEKVSTVDDLVSLRLVFLELICSVRGTVVIRSEGGEITKGTLRTSYVY